MKNRENIRTIIGTVVFVLLVLVAGYYILPAINLHSRRLWGFCLMPCFFVWLEVYGAYDSISWNRSDEKTKRLKTILGIATKICIAFVVMSVAVEIYSWKMFHAQAYRNLAQVESGNFAEDFPEADPTGNNIPFVSMEIAQQLGDRTIANVQGAEFYEVDDEYNLIEYKGDYYRISSLSYGGIFFKYFSAQKDGIPGYVLVNVRTQKATFCKVEGGYFYSPSALFGKDLHRHLRIKYPTVIFDSKSYFEIDEEGHPYWITPTITKTIGLFGGSKVENIIITDAVSGDSEMYNVESLPKWVDHAMLLSYLKDKAVDYYELVHGAFNFSDKDVKKLSDGYTSFVNDKGEVCFTMGLTPANEAKSNIGFILINSRTGIIKEYMVDGIQEATAQSRVETLVQNYGYSATFPQVINVEGVPTYLMCLVGDDGLIQDVALACISTTSNATAYAPTLEEAINKYKAVLSNSGAIIEEQPESTTISGVIQHIYTAEIEGTTYFFYVLEDSDKLYKASVSLNEKQVTLKEGDQIKLTYNQEDEITYVINLEF